MADLPLSREDRIMKDSKKQAQQAQQAQDRVADEFLYCDTDSITTTESCWRKLAKAEFEGFRETEREDRGVYCKWQAVLKNREVVTDSEEMSVYADYIRQCVNDYLEEYLGDKEVYFLATLNLSEEEPTLRMDVCEGEPNCFIWFSEGLRYAGLLDFRNVSPSSIEIVFKGLVRKMLKRGGASLRLTGLNQPLSSVILNTVFYLVNEYDYVNESEDGIL